MLWRLVLNDRYRFLIGRFCKSRGSHLDWRGRRSAGEGRRTGDHRHVELERLARDVGLGAIVREITVLSILEVNFGSTTKVGETHILAIVDADFGGSRARRVYGVVQLEQAAERIIRINLCCIIEEDEVEVL